jgi:DUF1680 family protein
MSRKSKTKLTPVSLKNVSIKGGFWEPRVRVNREVTLPIEYEQCQKTGRLDAWKLSWKPEDPNPPHIFWDSDVAKWIEAAAYSLTTHPDPELEKKVDGIIDRIAKAQQKNGYLNTHFTVVEPRKRWKNLRDWHELYCAGHLIEAAVAYHAATGKQKLLNVMCRYADYIRSVFGRGKRKKRGYPGHEEIELALVKLYRATGTRRYLNLAKFFINERGRQPHYFDIEAKARGENPSDYWAGSYDYCQAHVPVRQQTTAEGHAVRACYLYAGMVDVATETGDEELLQVCQTIWQNITEKRMYITGGIGSTHIGERFTFDYDLPNESAYAETCAAIALVFFAHRMLQVDGDGTYADVMERCLYNGIISGVSLDGKRFFYDNYLASYPGFHHFARRSSPERQEWFGCACCPPNLARLLASLGNYIYSQGKDEMYVHLYVDSEAQFTIGETRVSLRQNTEYPWKEQVILNVGVDKTVPFTLALRIPGWCREAHMRVNDKVIDIEKHVEKGYLKLQHMWKHGDTVELMLRMPAKRIEAHPSVRHNCGRVAFQRGPIVYCLEEFDNGKDLNAIVLPRSSRLFVKTYRNLFGGMPVITAKAQRCDTSDWEHTLYHPAGSSQIRDTVITAIPYFMWANREPGEMLVWIRET